jgi:hypothetical protein
MSKAQQGGLRQYFWNGVGSLLGGLGVTDPDSGVEVLKDVSDVASQYLKAAPYLVYDSFSGKSFKEGLDDLGEKLGGAIDFNRNYLEVFNDYAKSHGGVSLKELSGLTRFWRKSQEKYVMAELKNTSN